MRLILAFLVALFYGAAFAGNETIVRVAAGESLVAARDAARKCAKPCVVELGAGTYVLSEPLVLTAADSDVTWRAAKGARPVVSGGRRLTGWKKNADGTWSASVPKGVPYRLLTVNGVRAVRCRAPNKGEFLAAGETEKVGINHTLGDGKHPKLVYDPKDVDFAKLSDPSAGEIRIFHWWVDAHLRIGSVDSVSNIVTFAIPANKYTGKMCAGGKMCRYVAENFRSLLDEPGEWYLDAAAGRIDYLPRVGEDLAQAEVLLAETAELLRLDGNPESEATRVRNVTFSGLVFADAHAEMSPKDPINDEQGSAGIGAAIVLKGVRNIAFEDCALRDLGGYAIDVTDGSRDVAVRRSRMFRLGAGAVRADGAAANKDPRQMTRGVIVEDCEIGPYGLDWASAVGVLVKNASGCRIAHNRIHDGFYTAVSLGWSWGYGDSVARDNVVEWNVIEDIGKGLLNDMGGIYTLGLSPGTVIRGNVIRRVRRWSYGGHGLYQDEGSQGILIEKNLVVDTPEPIGIHYAREITYRNNIIAFHTTSEYMAWCGFHEHHVTAYFYDNVFYFDHGIPLGGGLTNPTPYAFPENPRAVQLGIDCPKRTDHIKADWNVFYNPNGREPRVDAALWDGKENRHSVWADPCFVDAAHGDFTLKSDSPALKLGFEPVDWSAAGPRTTPFKASQTTPVAGNCIKDSDPVKLGTRLFVNEDCWHFWTADSGEDYWKMKPGIDSTRSGLEHYIDEIARGQVTHFVMNINGQRANFPSKALEPIWVSLDEPERTHAKWVKTLKRLFDAGIDPYAVWIARCRAKDVSPWISIRMNDLHYTGDPKCPDISKLWHAHPELQLQPGNAWDNGFDYSKPQIRERMLGFIREVLARYDTDGIELDFLRFTRYLPIGRERELASVMTDFMTEVRKAARDASARLGHPVAIGVRVGAYPKMSVEKGLDVDIWAKRGLVDFVFPCNMWANIRFDISANDWRVWLGDKAEVVPGADSGITENGKRRQATREEYRRWATEMRKRGATDLYLFNLFLNPQDGDVWNGILSEGLCPNVFPLRGVYFATHFGNWYEKASDAEIAEYIAELKYWDCNYVSAWFDMHDFTGMDDPAAASRLRLIKTIFGSCRKNGMASCLGSLANEAFKESPPALRADGRAGQNGYTHNLAGYYHVEICPSKPGGLEQILKSRREVLAAFAGTPPDYFWSCPYDQGGCTCSNCAPWGANGYLRTAKSVAALVRQTFPRVKFSLSSWRFDAFGPKLGEWAGLCARQDEVRTWADMIVIDQNQLPLLEANPVLPYCPMVEISMDRMLPWGGFGANPRPKMLEGLIRRHPKMAGTMPYSEGLYEDLNKVIGLALLSGKAATARAAVEQYAARYFGAGTEGLVAEAVDILEDNLGHDAYVVQDGRRFDFYSLAEIDPARTWTLECRVSRLNAVRADRALALLNAAEAKMSAQAKKAWRWRVLKLRAELDVALGKGATAEALEPQFNELASIYRVGRDTAQCLVPPTRRYLRPGPEVLRNGDL